MQGGGGDGGGGCRGRPLDLDPSAGTRREHVS